MQSSDQNFRETGVRDVWNEECPLKSLDELLEVWHQYSLLNLQCVTLIPQLFTPIFFI